MGQKPYSYQITLRGKIILEYGLSLRGGGVTFIFRSTANLLQLVDANKEIIELESSGRIFGQFQCYSAVG